MFLCFVEGRIFFLFSFLSLSFFLFLQRVDFLSNKIGYFVEEVRRFLSKVLKVGWWSGSSGPEFKPQVLPKKKKIKQQKKKKTNYNPSVEEAA
jgi:hypothetical protein